MGVPRKRMNRRIGPWILLLCLNGAAWIFVARHPGDSKKVPPIRVEPKPKAAADPAPRSQTVSTNTFQWRQLESEDYRTYIRRLRNIGCPEQTIRDIIIADLEKLMASRVRQIDGTVEPPQYWKPTRKELTGTLASLEKAGQKQAIDFEKRAIVRELLGVDLVSERARTTGESDLYDERLGFLDPEKRGQIRMIMETANQEEIYLREKSWLENDRLTPEEKQQLREIQARKEEQIAAVLDPAEREQFDLWFSPSAYRVREVFRTLEPNETDFLALYRLQHEFDQRWEGVDSADLDPVQKMQLAEDQQVLEQGIREYLGEDRFALFQRTRDPDFRKLQDAAMQFGLSPQVAATVYDYRSALEEERERITLDPNLNHERKQQIIQALSEETELAVVEAMGPKAYRYYLRNGAGLWIWEASKP